jgi:hypothetical protein
MDLNAPDRAQLPGGLPSQQAVDRFATIDLEGFAPMAEANAHREHALRERDAVYQQKAARTRHEEQLHPNQREGNAELAKFDREIAEAEERRKRHAETADRLKADGKAKASLRGHVREYVEATGGRLKPAPFKVPLHITIADAQQQRAALAPRRKALATALPPKDEMARAITALVQQKAEAPRLVLAGKKPSITWPVVAAPLIDIGPGQILSFVAAAPLLCWAMPNKVIDELLAQLDTAYEGKEVMSATQRAKALAALDAEDLQLQRIEAELGWALRASGIAHKFRPTIDPRAVLGVDGPAPESN